MAGWVRQGLAESICERVFLIIINLFFFTSNVIRFKRIAAGHRELWWIFIGQGQGCSFTLRSGRVRSLHKNRVESTWAPCHQHINESAFHKKLKPRIECQVRTYWIDKNPLDPIHPRERETINPETTFCNLYSSSANRIRSKLKYLVNAINYDSQYPVNEHPFWNRFSKHGTNWNPWFIIVSRRDTSIATRHIISIYTYWEKNSRSMTSNGSGHPRPLVIVY